MSEKSTVRSLVDQLVPFVRDEKLGGRLYADLTDMLEACNWFVAAVGVPRPVPLTREELESLLVDIEVNMLQHLTHHIESLRKDLPAVLEAVGLPDDETE